MQSSWSCSLPMLWLPNQFQNLCCDLNWDGETITKASGFVHHIESASFLVAFNTLLEVLANLRGLTLKLQMQAGDVFYAYNYCRQFEGDEEQVRERVLKDLH